MARTIHSRMFSAHTALCLPFEKYDLDFKRVFVRVVDNEKKKFVICAFKPTHIEVELMRGTTTNCIDGFYTATAYKIFGLLATSDGVKKVEYRYPNSPKFYETPQDASVNNAIPHDISRTQISAVLDEALENSAWDGYYSASSDKVFAEVAFYYYEWNGAEAVKKYIDLTNHTELVLTNEGWRFKNNDFSDVQFAKKYVTKIKCEADNVLEIYDFDF